MTSGCLRYTLSLGVRCSYVQANGNAAAAVGKYYQVFRGLCDKLVLGCGSNVVDHIYNVKVVPNAGKKGFFLNPFKALEKKLIGGVTLNHLCWAALGGVDCGLLALQGEDVLGRFIRTNLRKLHVDTSFIKTDAKFSTSQCHVFIQEDGERSIVMAPASTSQIDAQAVQEYFEDAIQRHASMVTTEISQVPLSGVLATLKAARKANAVSVMDLDVSPTVAVNEAMLGTMEELVECVKSADILKPTQEAARQLLSLISGGGKENIALAKVTEELIKVCGSKAITNGKEGSIIANEDHVVVVGAPSVPTVVDTTGAGDAFLGGLLVGIKAHGMPSSREELRVIGEIANAYGAACTQSVGGVPVEDSRTLIQRYLPKNMADTFAKSNGVISMTNGDSHNCGVPSFFAESIRKDIAGIASLQGLDPVDVNDFLEVVDECQGHILLSGIGKSGLVAQRFSSSLCSIGISSQFVHAADWGHGDLGRARAGMDVVMFLSHSGNTEECVAAAWLLAARNITTLTVTSGKESKLKQVCTKALVYPGHSIQEPFGCLPTTSIAIQDVLLNAIMSELIHRRGISKKDFKLNHPSGSIGHVQE